MDVSFPLKHWIFASTFLWTLSSCNGDIPTRISTEFISGADPGLKLTNRSLCANFSDDVGINFQRLIIHDNILYIGATNHILQIDLETFKLDEYAALGPADDDPDCLAPPICRSSCGTLMCTDNKNRLMVPHRNGLLVCGSIYAGTCDILTLKNVSQPFQPAPNIDDLKCGGGNVAQITKRAGQPAVAGVFNHNSDPEKDLFYLGTRHDSGSYSVDVLFPPEPPNYGFKEIAKSGSYASGTRSRKFIGEVTTDTHNFMVWTTEYGSGTYSVLSRFCHATLNEFSRNRQEEGEEIYGRSSYTETNVSCAELTVASLTYYRYGRLYVMMSDGKGRYSLCSTLLTQVNQHIENARRSCYAGNGDKAEFIGQSPEEIMCKNITVEDLTVTCGLSQDLSRFLLAVRCKEALDLRQEFVWPAGTEPPTSLAVNLFDGSTVAFFGTKEGHVVKAKIGNSSKVFTEKITLDEDSPVLHDVGFDEVSEHHLYAMSTNKVFKVKLSHCEQYETCGKCVSSNDPYCGWCVLQSRCTHKSQCANSTNRQYWLKTDVQPSECPRISTISPNSLSIAESRTLSLTFGGSVLPARAYECDFVVAGTSIYNSPRLDSPSGPHCFSPADAPKIPEGQDHVNVTLNINADDAVVATGTLNIYDCGKIPSINKETMCGSCVTSSWNCQWCMNTNTCEDNCSTVGITAKSECPVLVKIINSALDVPVEKPHRFTLVTKNLPKTHPFDCVLDVCGSSSRLVVPGTQDGNNVTCNVLEKKLNCPKEDSDIVLSLKSANYYVDTPQKEDVTVGLFNCSGAQAECGLCIISHNKHPECGWCESENICTPQEDCQDEGVTNIRQCPEPVIETITPLNGPKNGGTEITITGKNLGSRHQEIETVFVQDESGNSYVNCTILPRKYVPSKAIVCETLAATRLPSHGKVHVRLSYLDKDLETEKEFHFKEVSVSHFQPKYALLGTKVTIDGTNLDVGNGANVRVSDGENDITSQCNDRTSNRLVCVLLPVASIGSYEIWTSLDGFSKKMEGTIQYVEQPNITKLVGREKLVSFYSGGLLASFEMTSLLGIQTAVLEVNGEAEEDCRLDHNTTTVVCPIPAMNSPDPENKKRFRRAVSSEDDVPTNSRAAAPTPVSGEIVINDQLRIPLSGNFDLSYVNNPVVNPLSSLPCRSTDTPTTSGRQADKPSFTGNDTAAPQQDDEETEQTVAVQLTGKYLDSAAVKDDYSIMISPLEGEAESVFCAPTFLDEDNLICKAPAAPLRQYEGITVQVMVTVGNLTFPLNAEYCPGGGETNLLAIIVSLGVVFLILIVIIIALLLMHRRRLRKQKKEQEQIMLMLDTLENKTRETARNAYFELQLGYMTTFTENLSDRITYLPPVSCFMRALFNDWKPDHPMLRSKASDAVLNPKSAGLDDFIQLLKNKEFLITLVRTLEEQKHFTVKEKGHFASLLTICLFDDMVYFTKVMMELLSDLIQKHVGKNPKLLLRRSESVVEKMVSHWLCINLHSQCIRDQAGKPLFLLTKAIHFLVNSAPSDVVASKAVNSLNEMTLLGSEVSYEVMILKASVIKKGEQSEVFDVKVVNCDTITQVKEKIIEAVYRDLPYSEYPKPDQMELELVAGQGHLVLSDIDNMSHREGNYTQINTLKHYNVPNEAAVVLSPIKQEVNGTTETGSPPPEPKRKRLYHLIHPRDKETNGFVEEDDSGNKTKALIGNLINQPFQEIYLTRMVKSKTTVQEYVDGVFNAILIPNPISRAVKYFFQFLDKEAAKHKISDPEVVHIWKTNSLLLRYWVNILKNPEFLFDVNKTAIVDSCLNVITQAFMDACTTTGHKLGQDSPSNKLLYAKDAERYRGMVAKFFENVSNEEMTDEEELNESLREVSKKYAADFDKRAAAQQLFEHLDRYRSQVQESIENESLKNRLNDVIMKISPETNGHSHETSILI